MSHRFIVIPKPRSAKMKVRSVLRRTEEEVPRQDLHTWIRQAISDQRRIDIQSAVSTSTGNTSSDIGGGGDKNGARDYHHHSSHSTQLMLLGHGADRPNANLIITSGGDGPGGGGRGEEGEVHVLLRQDLAGESGDKKRSKHSTRVSCCCTRTDLRSSHTDAIHRSPLTDHSRPEGIRLHHPISIPLPRLRDRHARLFPLPDIPPPFSHGLGERRRLVEE